MAFRVTPTGARLASDERTELSWPFPHRKAPTASRDLFQQIRGRRAVAAAGAQDQEVQSHGRSSAA